MTGAQASGELELAGLSEEQDLAAAHRSGPGQLSAPAGSGKTAVLVERFVRAVREDGIAPGSILAITFTERAAGELRARIRERLLALGDRDGARDAEAAFVSTFHGFCARLLRAHAVQAGLDPRFSILEEGAAGRLRERALAGALERFLAEGGPAALDLLAAYRVERMQTLLLDVHAMLRSRGERLPRLPLAAAREAVQERARKAASAAGEEGTVPGDAEDAQAAREALERDRRALAACERLDELLGAFAAAYEELKAQRAAVDFDDLEIRARELLETSEPVRSAWSERFVLLMVDEYQDTNRRQLAILGALERENLFTVGDDLQSIYGFRHAEVELFRERRAALAGTPGDLALRRNFRSSRAILDVVNRVFAERFEGYASALAVREAVPPARGTTVELLLTDISGWDADPELARAVAAGLPHAQLWRQAEARMLAQRVAELVRDGEASAGEVAVLLRSTGDIEVFERALQLAGLRTLAAVGDFWGHQQILDLLAYLRALANPLDELALLGALASPLAGVSRDGLAILARKGREPPAGLWQACLAAREDPAGAGLAGSASADRDALLSFVSLLEGEREAAPRRGLAELIERAVAASGYRERVLGMDWGERRLANVHKLMRLARGFEADEGRDLRAFLDHVAYLQEAGGREPHAAVEGVVPDAVRLMTIHAAKGLEFPVVCVADLGRQPNTQSPDLLVDGDRVGLRLVRTDLSRSDPALDFAALYDERRRREQQEEERVVYVAMTRARDRLLLSGSAELARWPAAGRAPTAISWLGPALRSDLAELLQSGAPALELVPEPARVLATCNTPAHAGRVLRLAPIAAAAPAGPPAAPAAAVPATAAPSDAASAGARGPAAGGPDAVAPAAARRTGADVTPAATGSAALPAPATLSYSALSDHARCAYRYYLERGLGLAEVGPGAAGTPGGELEPRARGAVVHALMEAVDFARPAPPDAERVRAAARLLGIEVSAAQAQEIAGLIEAALGAPLAQRIAQTREHRREHPFCFAPGPGLPLLTGVIDLLAQERGGGAVVLDYKTDRVGEEEDLEALVRRDYEIQRVVYALAVLRSGAPEVTVVHWFLERPGEPAQVRYGADRRAELEADLGGWIEGVLSGRFPVSPRPHRGLCLTCPGRGGLCSWGEAETLRESPEPAVEPPGGAGPPGPATADL
jgi:ATP-dependent exoDNAse (exonuclease V) beta subunit